MRPHSTLRPPGRSRGVGQQEDIRRGSGLDDQVRIRGRQIRIPALLETREAIEPFCAQLAARNRTDEDLERLDQANTDIAADGTLADFLQANVDWHIAVASHNELVTTVPEP